VQHGLLAGFFKDGFSSFAPMRIRRTNGHDIVASAWTAVFVAQPRSPTKKLLAMPQQTFFCCALL